MLLNIVCHFWLARRENATHRSLQSSLHQYWQFADPPNLPGEPMNSFCKLACFHSYHEGRFRSVCAKLISTGHAAKECQQICTASYTKRYALQMSANCLLSVVEGKVLCDTVRLHLCGLRFAGGPGGSNSCNMTADARKPSILKVDMRRTASMQRTAFMLGSERQSWLSDIVEAMI